MASVGLLWGEGRGSGVPRFWVSADVASDDGEPWGFAEESNALSPAGTGGEAVFTAAYLTVTAGAGALLQVTPVVNDDPTLTQSVAGGTVRVLQPRLVVPQQAGTPAVLRTQTFVVPLLVQVEHDGAVSVAYVRGESLRLRVESIGPLGTGAFRVEQCEIEHAVIRRSRFTAFTLG